MIRLIVAMSFLISVVPALAQTSDGALPPTLFQSESYFTPEVCGDILNPIEGKTFEQSIVKRMTTIAQANQLLYEYGLIFSDIHEAAAKNLIQEAGVLSNLASVPEQAMAVAGNKGNQKLVKSAIGGFQRLLQFKGEEGHQNLMLLLSKMEALAAVPGEGIQKAHSLVQYARVRNLAKVIRDLPSNHVLVQALQQYTQMTLELTFIDLLRQRINRVGSRVALWKSWRVPGHWQFGMSIAAVAIPAFVNFIYYGPSQESFSLTGLIISLSSSAAVPVIHLPGEIVARTKLKNLNQRAANLSQRTNRTYQFTGGQRLQPRAAFVAQSSRGTKLPSAPDGSLMEVAAQRGQILNFSPVEVAYLGHAEMLELKELYDRLMSDFGREPNRLKETREAAEAVLKEPKNFDAQLQLRTSLKGLFGSRPETQIRSDWALFQHKLEKFKRLMETIREIPYGIDYADKSAYTVNLARFLMQRLQKDLEELAEEEFNTENLEESLEQLAEQRFELEGILAGIKNYNGNWSAAAENTLLMLEKQ